MDIPAVCFIGDLARILGVSRRTIDKRRRRGIFPIPELPAIDKRARWSGDQVRAFLRAREDQQRRGWLKSA